MKIIRTYHAYTMYIKDKVKTVGMFLQSILPRYTYYIDAKTMYFCIVTCINYATYIMWNVYHWCFYITLKILWFICFIHESQMSLPLFWFSPLKINDRSPRCQDISLKSMSVQSILILHPHLWILHTSDGSSRDKNGTVYTID